MGKYFIHCFFCFCLLGAAGAQAQDPVLNSKKTIINAELGTQGIGLSAEWLHGHTVTVETSAFLGPSYAVDNEFLSFVLTPYYSRPAARFSITPRIYLNKDDRTRERRKKYLHADFYTGFGYSYITSSFDGFNSEAHLFTLHLGWRQFFSSRGSINAHVGGGYAVSPLDKTQTYYPSLGLKLGYRIN